MYLRARQSENLTDVCHEESSGSQFQEGAGCDDLIQGGLDPSDRIASRWVMRVLKRRRLERILIRQLAHGGLEERRVHLVGDLRGNGLG
jgi:hypothetical protein